MIVNGIDHFFWENQKEFFAIYEYAECTVMWKCHVGEIICSQH